MSQQEEEGSGSDGGSDEGDSGERDLADEVEEKENPEEEGDAEDEDSKEEGTRDSSDENQTETPEEANDLQEVEEKDGGPRGKLKRHKAMDKEDVRDLLRGMNRSKASGSGSGSSSSFDDSIANRRSIRTLQSSVMRDHELPMKIAYEQLEELAANAEKVKYAIEKNRNLLNVQVKKSNSRYLRAAFTAWKLQLDWKKTKRRDLEWAKRRWRRSLMSKAFRIWSRENLVTSKVKRLEKSVKNILARHLLRRSWKAWRAFTKAKTQEDDDRRRQRRLLKDLDHKHQDKVCRRACNFMYRWRLRRLFLGFRVDGMESNSLLLFALCVLAAKPQRTMKKDGCEISRMMFLRQLGIEKLLQKRMVKRMFSGWRDAVSRTAGTRTYLKTRQRSRSLQSSFTAWKSSKETELAESDLGDSTTDEFYRKHAKNVIAIAFATWQGTMSHRKQDEEYLKRLHLSLDKRLLARAFDAFMDGCHVSKWRGMREKRGCVKMDNWRLKKCFEAWICFMQIQAQKKMIRLQEHVVQVERENDRVRQENERLTHVIDSGDWGRKRIAELLQAGQILSGERDALTRLLGRMQRQHGFALNQQKVHEEEIQEMKNQLLKSKHRVRNKLLVKGASSFNSLIKAMKDDVLKNGTDSELLYTIDRLAMDEVTVFPDGDVHVRPVTNFDRGKGTWASRQSSPGAQNPGVPGPNLRGRGVTPNRSQARPKTPVQASNRQEVVSTPVTSNYVRSTTPMKGRAFGRFDYTQRLDRTREQAAPPMVVSGDRNVLVKGAVVKGAGYSREASPGPTR